MSPGVTARTETGNDTCTVLDCPGSRVTRVNPASRWSGTSTALTGWWTYTGTMSVPARLPVLATVNVPVPAPSRDTLPVADSPLTPHVLWARPTPHGPSGW